MPIKSEATPADSRLPIDEYLESDGVVIDLNLLLNGETTLKVGPSRWFEFDKLQAWTRVTLVDHDLEVNTYFRAEGSRFLVSDLGGIISDLRLRTGWYEPTFTTPWKNIENKCSDLGVHIFIRPDGTISAICMDEDGRRQGYGVDAGSLAGALRCIMRAGVMIAAMECPN